MDAVSKILWLLKGEARSEEGGFVEQNRQVADSAVGSIFSNLVANTISTSCSQAKVSTDLALQLLDDGMVGVDLERLLALHVRGHAAVAQCLCLHDALHVGRPAELAGGKHGR